VPLQSQEPLRIAEKGLCTNEMEIDPSEKEKPQKSQGKARERHSWKKDLIGGPQEAERPTSY